MSFLKILTSKFTFAATLLAALPATAHEFWISPVEYQVSAGTTLLADIRVGQGFEGSAFPYVPGNFTRFDLVRGDDVIPVEGRAGDRPALNMAAEGEGLAVVVHVTRDYSLTYPKWETFVGFTEHKDITWAQERHLERGLTKQSVKELYTRFAKSLIGIGDAKGADREVGLRTEIVAETNPYTDNLLDGFAVRVLYEGKPRADVQVELFDKAPGEAKGVSTYHRTNDQGQVILPVEAGHEYLVDSVVFNELDPTTHDGYAWESLWASLTFKAPVP
ncbi:DUF4198 domain-containing protein [Puniceibacterium sediminis]|uniref:GH25 family protein n=1 Tax=Puniceibacterium sediminis TaxID=1608407 RepID=A0A238UTU5_9RHOB|nr:DUF4198 domain-containing protein [Puniceibacterium sediminis]SNR25127.1 protein of unknown function [Puniceibacterium sediminis]